VATSPVTIIFGMSPSIANPLNENSGSRSNLLNLLVSQSLTPSYAPQGAETDSTDDFSESDNAQAAREKRLRARLIKWAKNPAALQNEFPTLRTRVEGREESPVPDVILIGGPATSSSAGMAVDVSAYMEKDRGAQFFRSAVLVPRTRSPSHERLNRMSRRREINELIMRMGIGAIGGVVESSPPFLEEPDQDLPFTPQSSKSPMWEGWSNKIESWSNVRKISDRAIGKAIVRQHGLKYDGKPFLVPTMVLWIIVHLAWMDCNKSLDIQAKWLKETFGDQLLDAKEDEASGAPGSSSDKAVENLKNDPDLDPHEGRLLPCIVDTGGLFYYEILRGTLNINQTR
jgi:hypothetical protein